VVHICRRVERLHQARVGALAHHDGEERLAQRVGLALDLAEAVLPDVGILRGVDDEAALGQAGGEARAETPTTCPWYCGATSVVCPICYTSGLGGGSGNAATTLLGLDELFGHPLAPGKLHDLAASLGSDIPFFLQDKPALAVVQAEVTNTQTKAVTLAKKLIEQDKVLAIIGPSSTGESMAIVDTVEKEKVPLLSCAASLGRRTCGLASRRGCAFVACCAGIDNIGYSYIYDFNYKRDGSARHLNIHEC
jgi:hypothetical protein